MLEVLWEPVNALVLLKHQRLAAFNIEEPARNRTVHNALFTAWIKRIFVLDIFNLPNDAFFFEALRDKLISCPDLEAILVRISDANLMKFLGPLWKIIAIIIDCMASRNAVFLAERKVVFAISRRNMNDASTIFGAHEVCRPNLMRIFIVANLIVHLKERHVFLASKLLALKLLLWLAISLAKHLLGKFRSKNYLLAIDGIEAIFKLVRNSERHISRQSPRRRRPSHHIFIRICELK